MATLLHSCIWREKIQQQAMINFNCIQLLLCCAGIMFCQGHGIRYFPTSTLPFGSFWFVSNYDSSNWEPECKRVPFSKTLYQTLEPGPSCTWYQRSRRQTHLFESPSIADKPHVFLEKKQQHLSHLSVCLPLFSLAAEIHVFFGWNAMFLDFYLHCHFWCCRLSQIRELHIMPGAKATHGTSGTTVELTERMEL